MSSSSRDRRFMPPRSEQMNAQTNWIAEKKKQIEEKLRKQKEKEDQEKDKEDKEKETGKGKEKEEAPKEKKQNVRYERWPQAGSGNGAVMDHWEEFTESFFALAPPPINLRLFNRFFYYTYM